MPEPTSFDLAKLDAWCGVRPGMTRAQVLEAMRAVELETEEYGDDTLMANSDEWEMEFRLTTDGSERVRQLSIDGDGVLWNDQPLTGTLLDDALRLLGSPDGAVWQPVDAIADPFPDSQGGPRAAKTDEDLLREGTVWIPERGLGLVISDGKVIGAAWRDTRDLPAQWAGPVTETQRQLSKRPDLDEHLRATYVARAPLPERTDPLRWPRRLVTLSILAAIAWQGKAALKEYNIWSKAPLLQARFVEVVTGPQKQFRDFVTPGLRWYLPRLKPQIADSYRVEVTPPDGKPAVQAVLESGDIYVPPRTADEEVPVAYVDGNPPLVKGGRRARDTVFLDQIPTIIALGILWLILQFALGILPPLWRRAKRLLPKLVPSSTVQDPDRPELR